VHNKFQQQQHNSLLTDLYSGQSWWAGTRTLRNINPIYRLQTSFSSDSSQALLTFPPRPRTIPLWRGSNTKDNPGDAAKRYPTNPRTTTLTWLDLLPWRRGCAHRQLHQAPPCRMMSSHLCCLVNVDVTFLQSFTMSIHLFLGLPCLLVPCTYPWSASFGYLVWSILCTWPKYCNSGNLCC